MARPSIVRADTLDLQDHENPTAADHQRHIHTDGLAPHQASELHHVREERHSEEQQLVDAWNLTGQLSPQHNASHEEELGHDEDGGIDGGEQQVESDDELIDRISSSPSIDDGGYSSLRMSSSAHSISWLQPFSTTSKSSTPTRSVGTKDGQSAQTTPTSSPYLEMPQHWPTRALDKPGGGELHTTSRLPLPTASSFVRATMQQTRVSNEEYVTSPLSMHHQMSKYAGATHNFGKLALASDCSSPLRKVGSTTTDRTRQVSDEDEILQTDSIDILRARNERMLHFAVTSMLDPSPSLTSIQSIDLASILLPLNDPLLDMPPTGNSDTLLELTSETGSQSSDTTTDSDDAKDAFLDLHDRFIDSGWGGECLRDSEDIDFEFVYALHTFVATVEGQANATKGDTMVLLDDSNSYWWLVRIVKDSSIGYLPAEHIETPTERLARLNKHRNIDLSAQMLSDTAEKSKKSTKKGLRRRNVKTVQFAAPVYFDASDYDYSSDEEGAMDPYANLSDTNAAAQQAQQAQQTQQEDGVANDIREPHAENRLSGSSNRASFDREQAATAAQALAQAGIGTDEPQLSPKLVDKTEAAPLKSRKGTPRNADSFLKDDTIETRKITLTPGLLREDSVSSNKSNGESGRNSSMESLTKTVSPPENKKDGKDSKKKDNKKEAKKGGMLSGLFKSKKKDKKKDDGETTDNEKASMDLGRSSPSISPAPTGRDSPADRAINTPPAATVQQRGKLQKSPPTSPSLASTASMAAAVVANKSPLAAPVAAQTAPQALTQYVAELDGAEVAADQTGATPAGTKAVGQPQRPLVSALKTSDADLKPEQTKKSKSRMELDDFDDAERQGSNPFDEDHEELDDSPIEVTSPTFMHGTENVHIPVPGALNQPGSSSENLSDHHPADGPGSLTSSPSLIDHPSDSDENEAILDLDPTPKSTSTTRHQQTPSNTTTKSISRLSPPTPTSATTSNATWNDANLRAWLEDGSEVRDMLVLIHDKTRMVTPVAADHPLLDGLFVEQRKGVESMMGELDGLLGRFLERKGVSY